jgi:hypothetical protein
MAQQLSRESVTAKKELQTMDLDRLNKALATYEVAEHIYNVDKGKTLGEALSLLEKANAQNDESVNNDDADPLSLKQALKHRAAPTGARSPTDGKMIQLGVNRTKTLFNGELVRKNPTKSFDDAVSKVDRVSKSMAEDKNCVPWKKRNVSSSQVAMVKKAVLKSVANKAACEAEHFGINEIAMNILKRHISLKENTLTPAQRSIVAKPSAAEGSYKVPSRVPSEFDSASQRAADTRARMPAEFKAKSLSDQKAGQMKTWNDASRSLDHQPNHEKSALNEPQNYDQNTNVPHVDGMTRTVLPQPNVKGRTPNYVGPVRTKSNFPNKEKNWDVNLKSPKKSEQQSSPIDGAI